MRNLNHLPLSVRVPIEEDNPSIMRLEEKCIRCGMCKDACANLMGVHGTYTLQQTGGNAVCIYCGQCANVCPVDSIVERDECPQVRQAMTDPEKIVVVSTSPAVRAALGEAFGMEPGAFVEGKMVALLRALGADYVLDTNFAADLTIVEEASELIRRITEKDRPLPQFTSCCPGWVHFAEIYAPELLPHLSTAKSPIGMQGPTVKTYFAKKLGLDPRRIVHVALTPCTAKKFEIRREEMHAAADYHGIEGMRDTDQVITTRELARWAKAEGIDWSTLEDSAYDSLMGQGLRCRRHFRQHRRRDGSRFAHSLRIPHWAGGAGIPALASGSPGIRGCAGGPGGHRRPDAPGRRHLRHRQRPEFPLPHEGERKTVPLR